jgi:integrase
MTPTPDAKEGTMPAKRDACRFNVGTKTEPRECGQPIAEGAHAACKTHRRKLVPTATPGVYYRGSRYVVVWLHRGRQHKASFRTYGEAREAKGKRDAGERRPPTRVVLEGYYEQWIAGYAGRTARGFDERSRHLYARSITDHVLLRWRAWKLQDVEPRDVRDLFAAMRAAGHSTSAIRGVRAAVSAMFATAVEDGQLSTNPVRGVRIPADTGADDDDQDDVKALTRDQFAALLAALPDRDRLFFEFLTHTGLRISEALGLQWGHVDLGARPKVRVREQLCEGKRKRLKSRQGKRDVPLSPGMRDRLLERRANGYRGDQSPLFATRAGTPLSRANVATRVLKPAARAVGVEASFHTFRHTCASLLFDAGRNVRQVSEWLGHADPAFTLRTYVHLMDDGVGDASFLDVAVGGQRGAMTHPHAVANVA